MYEKFADEYVSMKKEFKKHITKAEYITEKFIKHNISNEEIIKHVDSLYWLPLTMKRKFTLDEIRIIHNYIYWNCIIQSKLYTFEELLAINNENIKQLIDIKNAFNLIIYSLDNIPFEALYNYRHLFNFNNPMLYKKEMMNEDQINQIIFDGFAANIDWNALFYYQHKELSKEFKDKYFYRIKDNTFLVNKLA